MAALTEELKDVECHMRAENMKLGMETESEAEEASEDEGVMQID